MQWISVAIRGNDTWYVYASAVGRRARVGGGGALTPCICCQCAFSEPTFRSVLHSGHRTGWHWRAQYVIPNPFNRLPYASAKCPPINWSGLHTILTIFLMFFLMPNRSKRLVKTLNYRWSRYAHVESRRPSPPYKKFTIFPATLLNPSIPNSSPDTSITQWRSTAYITTLKIVEGQGLSLCDPPVPFEGIPRIAARSCPHAEVVPILAEQAESPGPRLSMWGCQYIYSDTRHCKTDEDWERSHIVPPP